MDTERIKKALNGDMDIHELQPLERAAVASFKSPKKKPVSRPARFILPAALEALARGRSI